MIPVLAVFCLAAAAAFFLPRKYESFSTIRVERAESGLQPIHSRVLTAKKLLGVVDRLGLYPEWKGRKSPGEIEGRMREDLRVSLVGVEGAASVFTVGYEGNSPDTARRVADALTSLYLEDDARIRQRRWAESLTALEAGMTAAREKLAAAEEKIARYRQEHMASMPDHAQANLQALQDLERRIEQAEEDERALKERELSLQAKLDTVTPSHAMYDPLVKSLGAVRSKMDGMDRVIRSLEKKGLDIRRRIEDAPAVEKEVRALEAEREAAQAEYDGLAKKEEAEAAAFETDKSNRGEVYTVVAAARAPNTPSKPDIPMILLAGLVLGLCGGLALAEWMDRGNGPFRSIEQAASGLPYPVLAAVPVLHPPGAARRRRTLKILFLGTGLAVIAVLILFRVVRWPW